VREETKKKVLSILTLTFVIAFAFSLGWGIYQFRMLQDYKMKTENQYKRALNDLVNNLDEVETCMSKVMVANSPAQKVLYLGETWKGSESAVSKMGQLPADEVGINYVDTLMNQVSDFSKSLTRKVASVEGMTPEELKMFNDMHDRVIDVNRAVQQISTQFYAENLAWLDKQPGFLERIGIGKILKTAAQGGESNGDNQGGQEASQQIPTSVGGGLKQLDTSLQKYPPFTYQGELDKHYVEKPLGLPQGDASESKAVSVAKDFLADMGYKNADPKITGLSQGPMGGYNMTYRDVYLEVSKKGGVLTYYRDQRDINERQMDVKKAVDQAYTAIQKLGWNLVVTSTEDLGDHVQVDAVAQESGVRLYPDKVRMTIAMDNGQVTGFDANPYYAYHHDRNLNKVLTLEQAKTKLNKNFAIIENRMAVISKLGTDEALCYEFRGTALGEEYLIYINALDGSEEKICRIVNTPRGKLIQ